MLKAITFDCYGTLVDWEAGISTFLANILREKGTVANIPDVVRVREDIDFEMVQGRYKPYREILRLSLKETFNRFHVPYVPEDGEKLAQSVPTWPVFQDTHPALERLSRRARLAIISNIDNDIIEKTKARIGAEFAATVTAQDVSAYKPTVKPFQKALKALRLKPESILHVSSGFRYDIPPARRLGFMTAWINRKSESAPQGQRADHELRNLLELADFVDARSA